MKFEAETRDLSIPLTSSPFQKRFLDILWAANDFPLHGSPEIVTTSGAFIWQGTAVELSSPEVPFDMLLPLVKSKVSKMGNKGTISDRFKSKTAVRNYTMNLTMSLTCAIIVAFSFTTTVLHVSDKLP